MNSHVLLITWKISFCLECDHAEQFEAKLNHSNNQFYRRYKCGSTWTSCPQASTHTPRPCLLENMFMCYQFRTANTFWGKHNTICIMFFFYQHNKKTLLMNRTVKDIAAKYSLTTYFVYPTQNPFLQYNMRSKRLVKVLTWRLSSWLKVMTESTR